MKISDLTQEERTIYVGLLTLEQKDSLIGQLFDDDSFFNPVQDNDENWIISLEEIEQNKNPEFSWLQDLEMIVFIPKINPMPI